MKSVHIESYLSFHEKYKVLLEEYNMEIRERLDNLLLKTLIRVNLLSSNEIDTYLNFNVLFKE